MFLHRIHINPRRNSVRRDLADPYQMHATLCRAFFPEGTKCPPGALLWRLEPETDAKGQPRILIQCGATPEWSRIPDPEWLAQADPGIDLEQKLGIDALAAGQQFRFRLRANSCKTVQSKRQGITQPDAQREWLTRKGVQHGFALPGSSAPDYFNFLESSNGHAYQDFRISQEQMLGGRQHDGNGIRVYSALFEGRLTVTDVVHFKKALETGLGHGKVMGLGLLSVVPTR
ncbi:type I-E CRISPR-associated protein Cas6/Cse3/CasE [Acidithiobacillus sp.]|jgi:CRISPR system Cascade subunit CasE|uniref:type I-E CRISPR-associated protein Cas6/Cse3/CasE n=1 Tax=Acidithiobacillus sp. TaxID=1872118 RepID=UPI0025B9D802|nr:type I-E CRISPR-associated protein Cas6/Cse3/CasE [Acidithiobacillus sp.]